MIGSTKSEEKSLLVFAIGLFVVIALIALFITSVMANPFLLDPGAFQCADCENKAKTESSVNENYDEIYLQDGSIITAIYIKAGDACYIPDGECYRIKDGGVHFPFVQIERLGDGPNCQAISHLEVCYEERVEETPTATPSITNTPFLPETDTPTPEVSETPTLTPDPTDTPEPSPTRTPCVPIPCGNG
jgi:hypothetical protein